MNRNTLGLLAIGLMLLGGVIVFGGKATDNVVGFASGCIRVGAVLFALWLALPQLQSVFLRTPRWLLVASAIVLIIVAITRSFVIAVIAIPTLGVLWFLSGKLTTKADKMVLQGPKPRRRRGA